MNKSFTHYVGLDCGNRSHVMYVVDAEGMKVFHQSISHDDTGLDAMVAALRNSIRDLSKVAACMEAPVGGLVETLQACGVSVFTINPKQVDRFRDRFTVSGAKDDRLDAMVLAMCLRSDFHLFKPFLPLPDEIAVLREYSRDDATMKEDFRRVCNRLYAKVNGLYPGLVVLCPGADARWFWDLLRRLDPSRRKSALRRCEVENLLRKYRIRRLQADEVLEAIKKGPLPVSEGSAKGMWASIINVCQQLDLLHNQLTTQRKKIRDQVNLICGLTTEGGRILRLLMSMPGLGIQLSTVLLTECYHLLVAGDLNKLRVYSGVAPVTRRSGGKEYHLMRHACNQRVRAAMHLFAKTAIVYDPMTKGYYRRLRSRGVRFAQALRTLGERFLRILVMMLHEDTEYDPTRLKQYKNRPEANTLNAATAPA